LTIISLSHNITNIQRLFNYLLKSYIYGRGLSMVICLPYNNIYIKVKARIII